MQSVHIHMETSNPRECNVDYPGWIARAGSAARDVQSCQQSKSGLISLIRHDMLIRAVISGLSDGSVAGGALVFIDSSFASLRAVNRTQVTAGLITCRGRLVIIVNSYMSIL